MTKYKRNHNWNLSNHRTVSPTPCPIAMDTFQLSPGNVLLKSSHPPCAFSDGRLEVAKGNLAVKSQVKSCTEKKCFLSMI